MASHDFACVYAALILNDENIHLTNDKIFSILNAANIKIDSYSIDLFIQYFKNLDISELIKRTNLRNSSSTPIPEETESNDNNNNFKGVEQGNEEEELEIGGFDDLFN